MFTESLRSVSRLSRIGLAASAALLAAGCGSAARSDGQSGGAGIVPVCDNGDFQVLYHGVYQVNLDDSHAPPLDAHTMDNVIADATRWYEHGGKGVQAIVTAEVADPRAERDVYFTAADNGANALRAALGHDGVRNSDVFAASRGKADPSDPLVTAQIGNVVIGVITPLCQSVPPGDTPLQAAAKP